MDKLFINTVIDIIGRFKDLKRSGWLRKNVINPESDAEHSFSTAFLVMLLAPDNLDKSKCLQIALAHDLAEIYAGDYTPGDSISPKDKSAKERAGILKIAQQLDHQELVDLFDEFEQKNSKESIFVNAIDKLDNVITSAYYDKNQRSQTQLVPEFRQYALMRINQLGCDKMLADIKNILADIN